MGAAVVGLYVHVPFCEVKCAYCHFAIDPRRPGADREGRYLSALLAEMEASPSAPADTLYVGGGTPTVMSAASLARVVDTAWRRFEWLRLARLGYYLRVRPAEANINGSILVYRLSAAEVTAATAGSLREWQQLIEQTVTAR